MRNRNAGGRPRKFSEPSRPITVTLPESTLKGLRQIDSDRGRAIVKLTSAALRKAHRPGVEIVKIAPHTGLLVIGPCPALRKISFLHLIEVAPARFILALDRGNDFKALELAVRDVLDDLPEAEREERQLIAELLRHTQSLRKSERVRMGEILFVNAEQEAD